MRPIEIAAKAFPSHSRASVSSERVQKKHSGASIFFSCEAHPGPGPWSPVRAKVHPCQRKRRGQQRRGRTHAAPTPRVSSDRNILSWQSSLALPQGYFKPSLHTHYTRISPVARPRDLIEPLLFDAASSKQVPNSNLLQTLLFSVVNLWRLPSLRWRSRPPCPPTPPAILLLWARGPPGTLVVDAILL